MTNLFHIQTKSLFLSVIVGDELEGSGLNETFQSFKSNQF